MPVRQLIRKHRQPHRCRRSGGAAGERGQGTRGERARCRGEPHRDHDRRRRAAAHRRHRRRRGHDAARPRPRGRAARDLEAPRRRPQHHPHARLPRRGAALDRRGRAALDYDPACRRAACLGAGGRRRRQVRAQAGGAEHRHPRRGARPVLRNAGAPEIPQERPRRGRGRARGGAPPRHEPARCGLHARRRGTRAGDLGGRAAWRRRPPGAARRCVERRVPRQCGRDPRRAERHHGRGLRGAADADARRTRSANISSSTDGRCATSCSSAWCAVPMPTTCRATAIRSLRCS